MIFTIQINTHALIIHIFIEVKCILFYQHTLDWRPFQQKSSWKGGTPLIFRPPSYESSHQVAFHSSVTWKFLALRSPPAEYTCLSMVGTDVSRNGMWKIRKIWLSNKTIYFYHIYILYLFMLCLLRESLFWHFHGPVWCWGKEDLPLSPDFFHWLPLCHLQHHCHHLPTDRVGYHSHK